jgi:hypothetical protein
MVSLVEPSPKRTRNEREMSLAGLSGGCEARESYQKGERHPVGRTVLMTGAVRQVGEASSPP